MTPESFTLSQLPHTWILDVDGTIFVHNGHIHGGDSLLPGVKEFFASLPEDDFVVLITSRKSKYAAELEAFLKLNGLRYNHIIYGAPVGERILINDVKPSGLRTAYAVSKLRDAPLRVPYRIDTEI